MPPNSPYSVSTSVQQNNRLFQGTPPVAGTFHFLPVINDVWGSGTGESIDWLVVDLASISGLTPAGASVGQNGATILIDGNGFQQGSFVESGLSAISRSAFRPTSLAQSS